MLLCYYYYISNLKPNCQNCNSSMETKNMKDFMKSLKIKTLLK